MQKTPSPTNRLEVELPATLAAALAAEIDPSEELRWRGQPDLGRVVRRQLPGFIAFALFITLFCGMALYAAWETRTELVDAARGMPAGTALKSSWASVWTMGAIGAAGFACVLFGLPLLLRAIYRLASRTIYAVTSTRVLSIQLNRRGVPSVQSVEPGHPLSLQRRDTGGGRGDVMLYPGRQPSSPGSMTLIGVENAREVERLIRATFDPPGR